MQCSFLMYSYLFLNVVFPLLYGCSIFRLFLATGITESVSSHACAFALRKICEDATAVIFELPNLEILIWIGEVIFSLIILTSQLNLKEYEIVKSLVTDDR